MSDRRYLSCVAWAIVIVLAWCSGAPAPHPDPEVARSGPAEHAYMPQRHLATTSLRETWTHGETPLDVSLMMPVEGGPSPLIIYLPGLGESAAAGILWRQTWAEAGYAVLTIQDAALGESVWASAKARAGDFRALAKEHFSTASLSARLGHLNFALRELKRRISAGKANYAAIDPLRIGIAGFDLGAQTAGAVIGEKDKGIGPEGIDAEVRSAILLSPHVESSGPGLARRFTAIKAPVLAVTGSEDADPLGLVNSPALRVAPWEAMPPGGKYLLLLAGGTHAELAGSSFAEAGASLAQAGNAGDGKAVGSKADRHGQHWNGGNPVARGFPEWDVGGHGGGQHSSGTAESAHSSHSGGRRSNVGPRPFNLRHIAAVRSVTTAFWDATLRNDPVALEWLAKDAARQLGDSASLKIR